MRDPFRSLVSRRAASCALLGWVAAFVFAGVGAAQGAPVLTLVIGSDPDGSQVFAEDLTSLWAERNSPTPERLAWTVVPAPRERLRSLGRGRGEFALLAADDAARLLPEFPRVKALAVLWPVYLHALTRNDAVQAVRLPPAAPVLALENAGYAFDGFWEWSPDGGASRDKLEIYPSGWMADVLSQLRQGVFLFSAPAPLQEIVDELQRDPGLRLVPFEPALLEEFRVNYPWLRMIVLPQGSYPRMRGNMELPARMMVMVGSLELAEGSVRKLLDTVYGARDAAARIDPLFRQIRAEANASFSPLLPYHPAAAAALGLAQKQP